VTENASFFERIASAVAETLNFPLTFEQHSLAGVASTILPTEAIGELAIEIATDARIRPRRFEFWGAETSLVRLRTELEKRGYSFKGFETHMGELRMLKHVPIDGPGFAAVLKEIATLARSLSRH